MPWEQPDIPEDPDEIIQRIQELEGTPPALAKLIFAGRALENDETVASSQ